MILTGKVKYKSAKGRGGLKSSHEDLEAHHSRNYLYGCDSFVFGGRRV